MRSLWSGSSGMSAMQLSIDTISNNLANVNTVGYKQSKANFQDLLYQELIPSGSVMSTGIEHPTGIQIGLGVKPASITKIFSQGSPTTTENPYDLTIMGTGFFQIELPDGDIAYSRDGTFKLDSNGSVVTADGYYLIPRIDVPEDAELYSVGRDGTVSVTLPGEVEAVEIGQIELATFINPQGLNALGQMERMNTRNLPFYAGHLVGQGMDKEEALKTKKELKFEKFYMPILTEGLYYKPPHTMDYIL